MAGTAKGGGYRGCDGIEKYLVDIGEAWEEYRVSAQEFRDLDERVVMLGRIEGRGRGSRRLDRIADRDDLRVSWRQDVAPPHLSRPRRGAASGRAGEVGDVGQSGPRALDLRGLGVR